MEFIFQPVELGDDMAMATIFGDTGCTHNNVKECGCIHNNVVGCACPQD